MEDSSVTGCWEDRRDWQGGHLTKAGGDRGGAILSQDAGRIGGIGKVVI